MPNRPTHTVTIEHWERTGDTVDDGMGGTEDVREWLPVVTDVPGRYTPAGMAGSIGVTQTDTGEVARERPIVTLEPVFVGTMVDGTFERVVEAGSEWRVYVHGLAGADRYKQIDRVRENYGLSQVPDSVSLELELQDE